MAHPNRAPLKLIVGIGLAIAIDTGAQLLWKISASRLPDTLSARATVEAVLNEPIFIALILVLAGQVINWLKVLKHADLSFAQPITSLSYVSVCVLSAVFLDEDMDAMKIAGILIVLAGVWFVSRTDHVTRHGEAKKS